MKTCYAKLLQSVICSILAIPSVVNGWQPGTYPIAPLRMHTSGFKVNTSNRNDVLAFWHAVYQASEGYHDRVAWTGNYAGNPGTTSKVFQDDVRRRINYYRAMCGISASVKLNTDSKIFTSAKDHYNAPLTTRKSTAAQEAALMLIRNYVPSTGKNPALSHDPAMALIGWSEVAWNGSANGNQAFGVYGPTAIDEYMEEELSSTVSTSGWNTLVGHRRWALYPKATNYASGDQPGTSASQPPTNVLYVAQNPGELAKITNHRFVTYPAKGYFPAPLNSRYWSCSRANADFSAATVSIKDSKGIAVSVTNVKSNATYADPALIWQVGGAAASTSLVKDATYKVSITGIRGTNVPASLNYSVTLINPDVLLSKQALSGPASPVSNQTSRYRFTPPSGAESLKVTAFTIDSAPWVETAEDGDCSRIIGDASANYDIRADMTKLYYFGPIFGKKAWRITIPVTYQQEIHGVPEQILELGHDLIANYNASLKFSYRRGFMTTTTSLIIEKSFDGGVSWQKVGNPITGVSNTDYGKEISTARFALTKSSKPFRIRFRYAAQPGTALYTHEAYPTYPTGIYLDDIKTVNCQVLQMQKSTMLSKTAKSYSFNVKTAGATLVEGRQWKLGLQTKLGGKWFPLGPLKTVTIAAP